MLVVHSWLQEFLNKTISPQQMAAAMEAAGIEVESITKTESLDSRIIVAKVEELKPIEGSKHLQLATVSIGSQSLAVVCGAPDARPGQYGALAQVGARLPDGTLIEAKAIRGQQSQGMLCSPQELGLGDNHEGLLELEAGLVLGTPLAKIFGETDTIIDISVAANRPDLRSLIGIAREVAAHTAAQTKATQQASLPRSAKGMFENKIGAFVPRYDLAKIKLGKGTALSPAWLQRRLQLAGIRPINLMVDITNYVMVETGQPLHGFDAAKVKGKIVIRRAKDGEAITTLDDKKRKLSSEDIVITDATGPVAIAGVMGGRDTEMSSQTETILLESATFDGTSIRRSAIRHNLVSEASLRFQHHLPKGFVTDGLDRALQLFSELAGGRLEQYSDSGAVEKTKTIKVDVKRLSQLLGLPITIKEARSQLKKIGFGTNSRSGQLAVMIPSWRPDINLAEDIYEEVIKLIGLENVPASLPPWQPREITADQYWPRIWQLRELFRGLGANEVTTYPFVGEGQIQDFGLDQWRHLRLKNPKAEEQSHMRTTLAPNLVEAVAGNSRQKSRFSLFEIARVFAPQEKGKMPLEIERYAVAAWRPKDGYLAVKNVLDQLAKEFNLELNLISTTGLPFLHPSRQAEVRVGKDIIAYIGELNPILANQLKLKGSLGYLEGWVGGLLQYERPSIFHPISRYPTVVRDITITVDSKISWQDVGQVINSSRAATAEYVGDYFTAKKRSLTIRLNIVPVDKTLTEPEIDRRLGEVVALLERNFAAQFKD